MMHLSGFEMKEFHADTTVVGKASNTKCYVELMSSSSCFDSS